MQKLFEKINLHKKGCVIIAIVVLVIAITAVVVLCLLSKDEQKSDDSNKSITTSSLSAESSTSDNRETITDTTKKGESSSSEKTSKDIDNNSSSQSNSNTHENQEETKNSSTTTTDIKGGTSSQGTEWEYKNGSLDGITSYNFNKYMTKNLSDGQKIVLNQILTAINNFQSVVLIKDNVIKKDDLDTLYNLFVLVKIACIDNTSVNSTYQYSQENGYINAIKLSYSKDRDQVEKENKELNKRVNEIMSKVSSSMSDYEKIKYFHDTIVKNCVYKETGTNDDSSAYGALVKGQAICEGYAKAFLLLCDAGKVDNIIVTGTAEDESGGYGSHMWNMVNCNGQWYHIDTTWDDPNMKDNDSNYIRYDFFNITQKEILKTHTIDANALYHIPVATSTKYNYFHYNKYYIARSADAEKTISKAVLDAANSATRYARIKCSSKAVYEATKKRLFVDNDGQLMFDILAKENESSKHKFETGTYSKILTDKTLVITIVLNY